MESHGHASFPSTALGRQNNEEATSGIRSLQYKHYNLEPRLRDEDDIRASSTSPNYHTNGTTMSLNQFDVYRRLHGGSLVAPELELATIRPRVRDRNNQATTATTYDLEIIHSK
ncbi:hypothetical protein TNCV_1374901 [Trichonephila clavipes]|nr:hypothetical protein TNCV_1374901 [Trichonephila clavipes]